METNLSIIPQTGMAVMRRNILDQEIEDAVIVEPNVMVEEDHPHFIESNTTEITLEELKNKCVVPVFGDNSLTISHQNFIEKVYLYLYVASIITVSDVNNVTFKKVRGV